MGRQERLSFGFSVLRSSQAGVTPLKATRLQFEYLRGLADEPRVARVSRRLCLSDSHGRRVCESLARRGLVEITRGEKCLAELTPSGRALVEGIS